VTLQIADTTIIVNIYAQLVTVLFPCGHASWIKSVIFRLHDQAIIKQTSSN